MRRRARQGSAEVFLLATLLLSCATGVGVYLVLKDHYAHAKTAEAAAPAPRPAPPVAVELPPEPAPVEPPMPEPPAPDPTDPQTEPDELTVEQVETTIAAARNRFVDCGIAGRLTLTLKIRPSGRVEQVTVDGTDSDESTTCVVAATKRIKFPKSGRGLTARYSLVGE